MSCHDSLVARWAQDIPTLGLWCNLSGDFAPELIAAQGPDYVCMDQQHGLLDFSSLVSMNQAVEVGGAMPIARVEWNAPASIMKTLDAGARGVIVPMVEDCDDAERFVAWSSYPPAGMRSYGPVRARVARGTGDPNALDDVARIIMIETAPALSRIEDIAAVEGIDCIYVGPSDLGLALGLTLGEQYGDPRFLEAVASIKQACKNNGIAVGVHCTDGEMAARYLADGFDMVTVTTDAALLQTGTSSHLAAARNGIS